MKSLKFTILILFLFSNLSFPQGNPPLKDKFYLGPFLTGYWPGFFDDQESHFFPMYNQLSYNMFQSYLVNEFKKAGYYEIDFTGINLATGVYFYRLEAAEFAQSKKMVLVK
jgi:hypothetical protein